MCIKMKNKITPYKDITWYIKWIASCCLIAGLMLRSAEVHTFDLYFTLVGCIMWGWVGYIWHDRAIFLVNAVAGVVVLLGIIT